MFEILSVKEWHCRVEPGQVGSGRVMEGNGFKNKNNKIVFYPKSLRLFLRILCVEFKKIPYMHVKGTSRALPATSLAIKYSN